MIARLMMMMKKRRRRRRRRRRGKRKMGLPQNNKSNSYIPPTGTIVPPFFKVPVLRDDQVDIVCLDLGCVTSQLLLSRWQW
jgi:hypothetical protein